MTSSIGSSQQVRASSEFWQGLGILWVCWLGVIFNLPVATHAQEEIWEVNFIRSMGERDRTHTNVIMNVSLLSEGKQALSCGKGGTVCLWDLASGKIVRRFTDDRFKIVYCLALLQDQRCFLAAGKGPSIVLWDIDSGQKLKEFEQTSTAYCLSILPDQKTFICGDANGKISLFTLDQKDPVKTWREASADITACIALPDQKRFITGGEDGKVKLWEMDKDKPVKEYQGLSSWTCCLQLSEDSKQLFASDYSGNVLLWETETAKKIWQRTKLSQKIPWGRFLEKQLIVFDTNNQFFLMDRKTGKSTPHPMVTGDAAGFDLDTRNLTFWSGGTQSVLGWKVETGERIFPADEAMPFVKGVQSLAVHRDRAYLLTKNRKNASALVVTWDLNSGEQLASTEIAAAIPSSYKKDTPLMLAPLDCGLAVGSDSEIAVFDYETHALKFAKKQRSTLLRKSLNKNSLVFRDKDPSKLYEINLVTDQTRLLLALPAESTLDDAQFLDNHHLAITLDQFPQKTELWSIDPAEMISQSVDDIISTIYACSPSRLLAKGESSTLLVFATPQQQHAALDPESLNRLLQNLDADDYEVREAATLALARGGKEVIKVLENRQTTTLESRMRKAKIARLVKDDAFPNLNRPLTCTTPLSQVPQAIAIDPEGQIFVISVNAGSKSELLICSIEDKSWRVVTQVPLRSRTSKVTSLAEKPGQFAVAFVDGTIDVVQVISPRSADNTTAVGPR